MLGILRPCGLPFGLATEACHLVSPFLKGQRDSAAMGAGQTKTATAPWTL